MPYDFKTLQCIRLTVPDAAFLTGYTDLVFHGIYAVKIRQQQAPFSSVAYDNTVTFYIQFCR